MICFGRFWRWWLRMSGRRHCREGVLLEDGGMASTVENDWESAGLELEIWKHSSFASKQFHNGTYSSKDTDDRFQGGPYCDSDKIP